MDAERVEARLAEARAAREAGHSEAVLHALRRAREEASQLPADHPLQQVTAWRLAKAAFDLGDPREMLRALEPILHHDDPFAHYPAGLRGAQRLARHYWDTVGYDAPSLLRLWRAYSAAHQRAGDPYLAAAGLVQMAWQLAATGDRDGLVDLMDALGSQTPDTFGTGPHRHSRAADTPTSVFHVQLDLCRTVLWSAVWTRDARLAREALRLQEDAAEDAGIELGADLWDLDPALRARLVFDLEVPDGWVTRWEEGLGRLGPPRNALHQHLASGTRARASGAWEAARGHFLEAAEHASSAGVGPEWEADALAEVLRTPDLPPALRADLLARLDRLIARRGVRAFAGAISSPTP